LYEKRIFFTANIILKILFTPFFKMIFVRNQALEAAIIALPHAIEEGFNYTLKCTEVIRFDPPNPWKTGWGIGL
jgi:hypothetical protein